MENVRTALSLFKALDDLERRRTKYSSLCTKLALVHEVKQDVFYRSKSFEFWDQYARQAENGEFFRAVCEEPYQKNHAELFFRHLEKYLLLRKEIRVSLNVLHHHKISLSLDLETDHRAPVYNFKEEISTAPKVIIKKVEDGLKLPSKLAHLLGTKFVPSAPEYEQIAMKIKPGELEEEVELLTVLDMMGKTPDGRIYTTHLGFGLDDYKRGIFNNLDEYREFKNTLYLMTSGRS